MWLFVRGKEVPLHLPLSNGSRAGQLLCSQLKRDFCSMRSSLIRYERWYCYVSAFFSCFSTSSIHCIFIIFQPVYDLSSRRGVDRPFQVGTSPKLYKFSFPHSVRVDQSLQLCCRHELHVVLPINKGEFTTEGLVHGDQVLYFCRRLVPDSIRVEVPIRRVFTAPAGAEMVVFLICYCGEQMQLTRATADSYRDILEAEISKHVTLRENRKGRLVSRPFPYPLLQQVIAEYN